MYNGSFTAPPCEENVTYVISAFPLMAPFDQILKISKVLIMNGNYNGNNRSLQANLKVVIRVLKLRRRGSLNTQAAQTPTVIFVNFCRRPCSV